MAAQNARPPGRRRRPGLPARMRLVLDALERTRATDAPDAIHRLRVALRRCRSLAAAMESVDPHPAWPKVREQSQQLFRRLGTLRETQVLRRGVRSVAAPHTALRRALLHVLDDREAELSKRVFRAVKHFDRGRWRRLSRILAERARLLPLDGLAAQHLAAERYERLRARHTRTSRTTQSNAWHELRMTVKDFRYAVECFLPARHAVWAAGLRRAQDLLGAIHDLDVLQTFVVQEAGGPADSAQRAIQARRQELMRRYRQRASGPRGLLRTWNDGLPHGARAAAAAAARLRATAKAVDPHPRQTVHIARLASRLFDALAATSRHAGADSRRARRILRTAAELRGLGSARRDTSQNRGARQLLNALPAPADWTLEDWQVVPFVMRYHRGAEPSAADRGFSRLPEAQQDLVRELAGVLRLARALHRSGATLPAGTHADDALVGLRLRVNGLRDTRKNAARLAAAKHLLESSLRRPIVIEPMDRTAAARQSPPVRA